MKKELPDFHKKNIEKRNDNFSDFSDNLPENSENKLSPGDEPDYPVLNLSTSHKDNNYDELYSAVTFFNNARYDTALRLFKSYPPDPAGWFKNLICTFHGPIGWLLMYNTKKNKETFINFCIANCYYRLGRYSEAFETIKNYYTDEIVYLKAWCQYRLGMHKESKENFKKAFYNNPRRLELPFPYKEEEVL